jgi:hypothetical protein
VADVDEAVNKIMEGAASKGLTEASTGPGVIDQIKEKLIEVRKLFSDMGVDEFASKVSGIIPQFAKDVAAGVGVPGAIKKLGTRAMNALNETIVLKVEEFFGIDSGAMQAKATEIGAALQGALNIVGIDIPLDFNAEGAKKALKEAFLGGVDIAADLGAAKFFASTAAGLKEVDKHLTPLIGNLDKYRATAGEISKIQINPFETSITADNSTSSAKDAAQSLEKDFAKQAINLRIGLGINAEDASRELSEVYSSLENYGAQLGGIKLELKSGEFKVGAEAIVYAARAAGVSVSTLASDINNMSFTMGVSGEDAMRNFQTIGKAASNTLLPMSKFHTEVMKAAQGFSLFGDNTEESAAMLERFISKADPRRIGASVEAFQSVAKGIAAMTDEMKAFVGMGTELAGGGGAIEAIVRMDAALASGDKDALQGIFDEAIARIEELSGAPVMTLKEAVSSGQENTFYQQTKMLEGMGLASGSAQASDIFDASKRGTVGIETIRGRGDGYSLAEGAIAKTRMGRGSLDVGQEMLGGGEDLARYNAMYESGAVSVMKHSDDLARKFIDLGQAVAGTSNVLEALKDFKEKANAIANKELPKNVAVDAAVSNAQISAQGADDTSVHDAQVKNNIASDYAVQGAQSSAFDNKVETAIAVSLAAARAVEAFEKANTDNDAALATEIAALGAKIEALGNQKIEIVLRGDIKQFIADAVNKAVGSTVGVSQTGP